MCGVVTNFFLAQKVKNRHVMTKSSQNDDEKILFIRTPNSQRLTIIVIYNMFKILNGNMNSEIQWGQYIHGLIY